mmetsp:Transcript_105433/g.191764  ORF Transcript_105433/g.191764 Transcript_105433/m.191764 type:complete len:401 (-) Transcript_105433:169-1371(-)
MAPQVCECPPDIVTDTAMNTTDTLVSVSPFIFSDTSKSKLKLVNNEAMPTDADKEEAVSFSEATTEFNTPPLREKGPDMSRAVHAHDEATSTDGGNDFVPFGTTLSSQATCLEDSEATAESPGVYSKKLMLHLRSAALDCPSDTSGFAALCASRDQLARAAVSHYSTRHIDELPCPFSSGHSCPENGQMEEIERVQMCLSKLTGDSFNAVFEELLHRLTGQEQITTLIREIFDKATSRHQGVPLYAELCVRLGADPRVLALCEPSGEKAFRRILLIECQLRFEEMSGKRQARGIMKFIGELLVRGMLSPKLLVEIAEELLRSWEVCVEAAFEPLVTLLVVAGPQFDTPSYRYYSRLLGVLSSMDELTKDESTPEAMRMLLHSVLELRNSGWSSKTRRPKS